MKYTAVDQIIKKRGKGYQILAKEIDSFFSKGGDWTSFRDHEDAMECDGGNEWWWDEIDDEIHLTFQWGAQTKKPTAMLDKKVFWEIIQILGSK